MNIYRIVLYTSKFSFSYTLALLYLYKKMLLLLSQVRREKNFVDSLARDSQGNLVYLPANAWRLERTTDDWPEIHFLQTMEIN